MNCKTIDKLLDEYESNELSLKQHNMINQHLSTCAPCQTNHRRLKQYLHLAHNFKTPKLSAKRRHEMLNTARNAQQNQSRFSDHFQYQMVAACLLTVVLLSGFFYPFSPSATNTNIVELEQQYQKVSLVINVPADMLQADLSLQFPDQLRWQGYEDMNKIEWTVDLQKGPNVLTLPVKLKLGTDLLEPMVIFASLSYGEQQRDFELSVNLKDYIES